MGQVKMRKRMLNGCGTEQIGLKCGTDMGLKSGTDMGLKCGTDMGFKLSFNLIFVLFRILT